MHQGNEGLHKSKVQNVRVFVSHLSSVASQIERRKVIRVAHTEVDNIHQVGGHVHNYRRRERVTQWGFKTHIFVLFFKRTALNYKGQNELLEDTRTNISLSIQQKVSKTSS